MSTEGAEWKILEEVLPKYLTRRLKMSMTGIFDIALSIILGQCLICNYVFLKYVQVLTFWLAQLTKKARGHMLEAKIGNNRGLPV